MLVLFIILAVLDLIYFAYNAFWMFELTYEDNKRYFIRYIASGLTFWVIVIAIIVHLIFW